VPQSAAMIGSRLNVATAAMDMSVASRATRLADSIDGRENALIYRARFPDEPHPLALRLWDKLNDFTHLPLQIRLRDDLLYMIIVL
jgi:hypothetical protein